MKKNLLLTAFVVLVLGILMLAAACSSASPTTTLPPTTTATTPPPTTTTMPSPPPTTSTTPPTTVTATTPPPTTTTTATTTGTTFQTLASAGQSVYTSTCMVCHGSNGGGSQVCPVTIWGDGSTLGNYNGVTLFTDAQGMLNYISKSMPLTAPGSLNRQQYLEAMSYILLKGNLVSGSTVYDASHLGSISIP